MQLQKGQRDKLSKYLDTNQEIEVNISNSGISDYECVCFGITEGSKNAKTFAAHENINGVEKFSFNLKDLNSVSKIIFALKVNGDGDMTGIKKHSLTLTQNGKVIISAEFKGEDFSCEKAITSIEIYKKNTNDEWRIACVASGFNGGINELLNSYGILESSLKPVIKNPSSEINLEKGRKINITINPKITTEIVINLSWHRGKKSIFKSAIDLDVGCLYELRTGMRGCIQALGRDLGSLDYPPYIALDGDDKTGDVRAGENLRINCLKFSEIKRILIYAFIYEGAANWQEVDGVVTLKCPESGDIKIKIQDFNTKQRICAVGMFENIGNTNNGFTLENLTEFFDGQEEMDKNYGWGLNWIPGRK